MYDYVSVFYVVRGVFQVPRGPGSIEDQERVVSASQVPALYKQLSPEMQDGRKQDLWCVSKIMKKPRKALDCHETVLRSRSSSSKRKG